MTCSSEQRIHPPPYSIAAGLTRIPRQAASFDDFRAAMLAAAPLQTALGSWREQADDFGVMLLELWAYVCHVQTFYDEVHAHEAYLRTARLDPSVRKLVELLGYLPRPAVAATVALAVTASGRLAVEIPAVSGARSGAFDSEPPQLFETAAASTVHPLANQWQLEAPRRLTAGDSTESTFTQLYIDAKTARLRVGDVLLVQVVTDASLTQLRLVTAVETVTADDGEKYVLATFENAVTLNQTPVADIRLYRVNERIALWSTVVSGSSNPAAVVSATTTPILTLDGVYRQIKRSDTVLVSRDGEYRWFVINALAEEQLEVVAATTIESTVPNADETGTVTTSVDVPAIKAPATRITLDVSLNTSARGTGGAANTWAAGDASRLIVHYGLTEVGRVVVPAQTTVSPTDTLLLRTPVELPSDGWTPSRFILVDRNGSSVDSAGSIDYTTRVLTLDPETTWSPDLVLPIQVYGNVIEAERGETVTSEILGSGDASVSHQSFALKKWPLTYLPVRAPDGSPVTSTLEVFVDDVQWTEARSFYDAAADAAIYIVRQDDEQKSRVIFGDGVRGRRVPSGTGNVRATYRFGGGAAAPPAGGVTQLAAPISQIKSWWNPQPAYGGDDAESAANVKRDAPRSALVLGRAVSLVDLEAVAASVGGVRAVRAEWRWHGQQQRPVARICYIGLPGVASLVTSALRTVCDPSTPIDVEMAVAVPSTIELDVQIDDRYDSEVVAREILDLLMTTETGLLVPERIGIGRPLVRSRLFRDVLSIDGTEAVRGILLNGTDFNTPGVAIAAGTYFDFETGTVSVNGLTE